MGNSQRVHSVYQLDEVGVASDRCVNLVRQHVIPRGMVVANDGCQMGQRRKVVKKLLAFLAMVVRLFAVK